ncbi:MAG: hypothetical protein JWO22_3469 [Frankiales bacterium]|nr:hypothetical protein [Frankiales bacterium]
MATAPTRIDEDVFAAAKVAAIANSRSATQQVNHWARIGKALEASGTIRARDITNVLAGKGSYDDLNSHEQAVVRADWNEQMDAAREHLDLAAEFVAEGAGWVEASSKGTPVKRKSVTARRKAS